MKSKGPHITQELNIIFCMVFNEYDFGKFFRLRDLLHSEEQQYIKDISGKEETLIERQAKMRERAKILKEQREAYRQEFVEEKLRQQWR